MTCETVYCDRPATLRVTFWALGLRLRKDCCRPCAGGFARRLGVADVSVVAL